MEYAEKSRKKINLNPSFLRSSYPIVLPHLTLESDESYFGKIKLRGNHHNANFLLYNFNGKTTYQEILDNRSVDINLTELQARFNKYIIKSI